MNSKLKIKFLVVGAIATLLAGCQTTKNNKFSEWEQKPLGKSRFNVPTISNVPVTKLEQNERNNGQVQNDKWELACGQGFVTTAHTFDGWFVTQTEAELADEDEFRATFKNTGIVIQNAIPITSNANGKAVGYYGDAKLNDLPNCTVAKFGVRAVRGVKIYDSDRGTIDTIVTAFYCGQSEFNMPRFTQQLSVIDDREAYAAQVNGLPSARCGSDGGQADVSSQTAGTDWVSNTKLGTYEGTVDMSWGNNLQDSDLAANISVRDYGGALKFAGPSKDQCNLQFRVTKYDTPEAGTWFANCKAGDFASGDFRVDKTRRLIAEGENDAKDAVEFSLLLPQP
ncbi:MULTISPECIES: hypothetical protein [unclassified Thalassospira]|uniref:hypothetical protein n=1 Tax=unclassified Thalassospira TaxID=2648997 RepID=UPI000EC73620|nr:MULTISPECIES: hypothetical protein [unclassified Thalassospira]HAI30149.1 hypothetical protein [Thalassospira sp.]|tara:strand:- start:9858 stop:10874 length:1017 start_codon:yes stop_codon:yes gene_type:complete